MTTAKVSCRTCKHFNEGQINGKTVHVCTLKVFAMTARQANLDRTNWTHYSGDFKNPNACKDWKNL